MYDQGVETYQMRCYKYNQMGGLPKMSTAFGAFLSATMAYGTGTLCKKIDEVNYTLQKILTYSYECQF